jgi:acetyl esterase/lipase
VWSASIGLGILVSIHVGAALADGLDERQFPVTRFVTDPDLRDDCVAPSSISGEAQFFFSQLFGKCPALGATAVYEIPEGPEDVERILQWTTKQKQLVDAVEPIDANAEAEFLVEGGTVLRGETLGGVPILDVRPADWRRNKKKLIVYFHGGAFTAHTAESTRGIPIYVARATGLRVVSVDYTLSPVDFRDPGLNEQPPTASINDYRTVRAEALNVIRALKHKGYKSRNMALLGESAGGSISAGTALEMRDEGLGLPAAVVLWSAATDLLFKGDTFFTMKPYDPALNLDALVVSADAYAPTDDDKRLPFVSAINGDFAGGYPPTLIQVGSREIFLSLAARFWQTLDDAGQDAELQVFDGMWHTFQIYAAPYAPGYPGLPESLLALDKTAIFLAEHLRTGDHDHNDDDD